MSRILRCDPQNPDDTVLETAVEVLTSGGALVLPTETQYGLAIRADRNDSLSTICRIKKRNEVLKPALFVKDMDMAEKLCLVDNAARRLAAVFLPGPLTLILPPLSNQSMFSPEFMSEDGIGIRISSSPIVSGIMKRLSFPISATSANISGHSTPDTITDIVALMGDQVELYIDGGPCRATTPSTVVKLNAHMTVIRHGQIAEAEIRKALDRKVGG